MTFALFFGFLIFSLQSLDSYAIRKRIIDGKPASIQDFPYLVSIQNYYGTNHHCGGIIIDPYYVLTAAHCIDGFNPDEFRIVSGTVDWTKPGSIHYVSDLIPHKAFDSQDTWNNDIGLIKVSKPFSFGPTTGAAQLPARNADLKVNTVGIAIGFGRTSENSNPSKVLLRTELIVQELTYCNQIYKRYNFKDTQICTQGANNAAIFKGDSGGPLIVGNTVVGIAFTGLPKYPSAFTKISKHIDWINAMKKSTR